MKVLIADPISKHGLSILSDSGLELIIYGLFIMRKVQAAESAGNSAVYG